MNLLKTETWLIPFVALLLPVLGCTPEDRAEPEPPNVLVLMADEHAWYAFGAAGNSIVQTPNLDRLAARGAMFTAAYATWPACVAARMSC